MKPLPTKIPGIPKPPASAGPELRRYLEAMSEALEIRLGRRGDPVDRAVTLRELIQSGLARELKSASFDPNNISETTIGFVDDGQIDVTNTPPPPTGFTVSAGFRVINLMWDYPIYTGPNHSHTEIYSYPSDSLGDAVAAGVTGVIRGRGYSDPVGGGVTRYYWIRHVNEAGTVGPWYSTTGQAGTTAADVTELLTTLSNSITSSELAASLATPIGNLPNDTVTSINSLQTQINTLSTIDAWASGESYSVNDLVTYNGNLYEAQSAHTASSSNAPSGTTADNTTWNFVGAYTSLAAAVAGNTSDISDINFVDATSGSAIARSVQSLDSEVNDTSTGLSATRSTLLTDYSTTANMNTAISQAVTGLASTSYVTTQLGSYTTTSSLETNYYTKTAADSAIASATSGLASQTYVTNQLANYTTTATLQSQYYTQTATDSAITAATTDMATQTHVATELGDYTTTATLQQQYYTKTGADNAISAAISGLASQTYVTTQLGSYTTTATLQQQYYTKTGADNAISAAISGLASQTYVTTQLGSYTTTADLQQNYYTKTATDNAISSGTSTFQTATQVQSLIDTSLTSYTTTALLQQNYYTETDTDNAISTAITTSQSGFADPNGGSNTVTLQQALTTQASINGDLEGQYTVKIDANGHVAGFGLASTGTAAGGSTSEFFVNADKFAVLPDAVTSADAAWSSSTTYSIGNRVTHNGKLYQARVTSQNQQPPNASYWDDLSIAPFAVTSSGTTVDGVYVPAGVYINSASIKHASITSAQIGSVNADTIDTGILNVADRINANAIDASKLVIDGSSLTSVVVNGTPTLQLGTVNVNKLTGNSISATIMSGTTVYANKLTGDVSVILPFRSTTTVQFAGNTASTSQGGTKVVTTQQLPATSHLTNGHKPYASVTGWYDSTGSKTYSFKLYMRDNAGSSSTIGTVTLAYTIYTTNVARVSGNVSSLVASGDTVTATGKSHTVTSVTYDSTNNWTNIAYSIVSGSSFTTGETISNTGAGNYQLVGETRFKSNTNLYAQFSLSGSLSNKTLGTVDMKLEVTRTGSSGVNDNDNGTNVDYIHEVSGFIMGAR